jgi:hypothetical protein
MVPGELCGEWVHPQVRTQSQRAGGYAGGSGLADCEQHLPSTSLPRAELAPLGSTHHWKNLTLDLTPAFLESSCCEQT